MLLLFVIFLVGLAGLLLWFVGVFVQRRGQGFVARRGTGPAADVGALRGSPRVRVSEVTGAGPDRVRIVLIPDTDDDAEPTNSDGTGTMELEVVVYLDQDEFGFELLHEWKRAGAPLALVMPADTRIIRLRSVNDLQPLTLRRADE